MPSCPRERAFGVRTASSVHAYRRRPSRPSDAAKPRAFDHRDLEVLAEAGREAGLAQREVVLPHPDEPLVEAERADLVEPAEERASARRASVRT